MSDNKISNELAKAYVQISQTEDDGTSSLHSDIEYNFIPFILENSSFSHINIFDFIIYSFIIIPININSIFINIIRCFSLFILFLVKQSNNNKNGIL